MILKGLVSSINADGVRVVFPDKGNGISAPLKVAINVGELKVSDNVVVVFFSGSMIDGLIIAQF